MALLACRDAAFAYDGQVVLSGVTFEVNAGDYLCIVGENGSGKTTLMKGLLRLVAPLRGKIILGEVLRQDEIGYLPQQSPAQRDFPASVKEVVESGLRGKRLFLRHRDRERAREALELLEAASLYGRSFMDLSGGQKQRVLLARALCSAKKLLLMDEPTAGLDPIVARELYRLIEKINREKGIAVVMISHDVHTASQFATHILHLQQTPLYYGRTEDYMNTYHAQCLMGGTCHV